MSDGRRKVAPYGSWESPLGIDLLVAGRVSLDEVRFDGPDTLVWIESRPEDGGRATLVRWTEADGARDISPAGMNVRSRVHEYGGAPSLVAGDLIVVSDFATGRLHRVAEDRSSAPITPDGPWRFADLVLDRRRNRLLAVREDHGGAEEAVNSLVSVPLDGGDVTVVAAGRTFYGAPRLSPDGTQLALLAWDHPNMPWDGTELYVADVAADGTVGPPRLIAGSASDWISQPAWSPSGELHFVAEVTGWMNLQRWVDGRVEPVTDLEAEFAAPDWQFGYRNHAFVPDGTIIAIARSGGRDRLYRVPAGGGDAEPIDVPFTEMESIDVSAGRAVMLAASPTTFSAVVIVDLADGERRVIRTSSSASFDAAQLSVPEPVEFPTTHGRTAHGLFYRPTNPGVEGPRDERPPLIVTSHGGPTAQSFGGLSVGIQLFTSRGYAVLDVDYGGSTGYGRAYRKRLEGQWGIVDVDDCVAGTRHLADRGDIDGERVAVRGGSASGYTALCALAFRDDFSAGISYFGIGDLLTFARDTHKFESRYLDRLLGPLPEAEAIYRERSPNRYSDRIRCPVLILQGKDDHVVPLAQAESIVDALWERRIPYAYLAFDGEDHGFRKADSIIRSFEAELSFLGQVFGCEPADPIEPIVVENLVEWRATRAGSAAG